MTMNCFTATVERDSGWWVGQLDQDPGVIVQARRLDQIENEFKDALGLFPELTHDAESAQIELAIGGEAEKAALSARDELEELRRREHDQLGKIAQHAKDLSERGYNYRDIAYLLGISYGRVGQILKQHSAA
ncbi:hypothetical protein [Corynebacterium faecium]|uniref:hypothetical protein n=1 Tax=Corynebacterium faecium TaxID=3016001 RepID=UPI0022B3EBF2|nr:hypothetical protein [Corynebacterium faecium]